MHTLVLHLQDITDCLCSGDPVIRKCKNLIQEQKIAFLRCDHFARKIQSIKNIGFLLCLLLLIQLPTYAQIAQAMNIEVGEVILAFEANQFMYSLDEPIYENDGSAIVLEDRVEDPKQTDIVMKLSLRKEFARLEQREQLILHYRYDLNMKQEDIAKRLHISQVQVSRLEKKILWKLKERLVAN